MDSLSKDAEYKYFNHDTIDMGPEGGRNGGTVLATGTPEEVAESTKGFTPRFLKKELQA